MPRGPKLVRIASQTAEKIKKNQLANKQINISKLKNINYKQFFKNFTKNQKITSEQQS